MLPEAERLGTEVNRYNQAELLKALRGAIPGYDELVADISGNIESGLKGEIPSDVSDVVQNSAAARALAGGYGSSGMFGNLVARDLGLTSYNISQRALDSAQHWLQVGAQSLTTPRFDVSRAFVSPVEQFRADTEREANMFNYRRYLEKLRVQPEPWEKAVEGLLDWVATTGLSIASAYTGNIGGIMGGMGGGGGGNAATGGSYLPSGFAGGANGGNPTNMYRNYANFVTDAISGY